MAHVVNEDPWCGLVGNEWKTGMRGAEVKALVDDGVGGLSGGIGINPIFFDTQIVTHPLLSGELFPNVQVVDVPRGSTIDGAAVGTPTVIWDNAEGTSQDLFDTSGLVNGWGKTIHPVAVYVEIGRDLMADAPIDIGETLTTVIGERFSAELDKVIAIGNGTTQPEGIFNAASLNSISSTNGSGGPLVIADLENLSFGIGKQYRVPSWKPAFVCNDQDYRRARAIPWGSGSAFTAQARALGPAYSEYKLLEWDAKIQNDIPQNSIVFGCLRKYRMYRRQGLEMRFVTEGMQLTQRNTVLLACRARYGGFVTDPQAFALMSDAPVHDGIYYTPS
jgi:HK97 family phage major capsid protein